MIEYNIQELPVNQVIKQYVRRFLYTEAKVESPFDQPFFPSGYVKIPHPLKGRPAISIPDKGIVREVVDDGPYFSGIIHGDNAYMHFVEDLHWITMELKAGAPYYLFHLDMTDLVNVTTHFSKVSNIANDFNTKAIAASNLEEVMNAYEDFIKKCIQNRKAPVDYINDSVELIEFRKGNISIEELLDTVKIPIGKRQFIRNFKKVVGLSPKHWCRVRQIEYVNDLMMQRQDLTTIAHQAGFFDQPHFNRTFQEFIRSSPKAFIASNEPDIAKYLLRGIKDKA